MSRGVQCAGMLGCPTDGWMMLGYLIVGLAVFLVAIWYVAFLPRNYAAGGEEST